jgi:hypothetical protein
VYGQPFIADIVVPLDGSSSVVIKSVPAGRMDLTAEPVPPLDGAGWSCEGSGPQVICTGSGPTGLSILAVAASHGSSSARMANQGPSQPAVVSLVLTDPAGTMTAAEVTVGEAPDPTPTDTGTPTSTETGTPTDTGTPTVTETATSTETGTPTVTETATSTETVTVTPTETWTWTWTWTRRDPSTWMPSSSPIVTVLSTATETMTAPETVQPTDTVTTSDTVTISPSGVIIITSPGKAIG